MSIMTIYKVQRDDYLEHFGFKKKHKYIKKIGTGKDARYFYSQAEIDAYLAGQKSSIENAASNIATNAKNMLQNKANDISNAINKYRSKSITVGDKAKAAAGSAVVAAKVTKEAFDNTKNPITALNTGKNAAKVAYGEQIADKIGKKVGKQLAKKLYYVKTKKASSSNPITIKNKDGSSRTSFGYDKNGKESYSIKDKNGNIEFHKPRKGILGKLGIEEVTTATCN